MYRYGTNWYVPGGARDYGNLQNVMRALG